MLSDFAKSTLKECRRKNVRNCCYMWDCVSPDETPEDYVQRFKLRFWSDSDATIVDCEQGEMDGKSDYESVRVKEVKLIGEVWRALWYLLWVPHQPIHDTWTKYKETSINDQIHGHYLPIYCKLFYFEAVRYRKEHPGPEYPCPACNRLLKYRPVKVFDGKALEQTFKSSGTPEECGVNPGKGSDKPFYMELSGDEPYREMAAKDIGVVALGVQPVSQSPAPR
ncbi:hypothetical protein BDM02DRAFT_3131945 [Thelephora ganbajun]|uniref:Uncharacterized protein n=1 Tax=Thelephora ganbajun TaxID=370292 RepID=A0ACB6Z3R1_THEGA|nr:hypothetical protein BDM02DRAFT_3131945 [Thelephora ganbajun]